MTLDPFTDQPDDEPTVLEDPYLPTIASQAPQESLCKCGQAYPNDERRDAHWRECRLNNKRREGED